MKRCKICGETKPLDEFYISKLGRDGHRLDCKTCNLGARKAKYAANPQPYIDRVKKWQQENSERLNEYRREYRKRPDRKRADRDGHPRRKYGIGVNDYEQMLVAQQGGCAICGDPAPDEGNLHVDHDHVSGRVRGLLCVSCNNALGAFRESLDIFQAAANYLDQDEELALFIRGRVGALAG